MRRTAQILSVDNQEYEAAGVALNCFSLLNHVRAALEGPAADRAPCGVKSRPTGLPEADDAADRDGDRQPRAGREKDGQGESLANFANPADLPSPLGDFSGVRTSRHFSRQNMVNPNAALLKFRPKSLPPARQPRSERPKIHIQPRSDDLVTISRHRGEHDSLSHALRHALQFTFDVSDNETEESWRID